MARRSRDQQDATGQGETPRRNPSQQDREVLLPPRTVLLALGQARELPRNLQVLLWNSGDETAQSLIAALGNIEKDLEDHVLSGNNTRLLSAWAGAPGRRRDNLEGVAKKWGAQPHIASALLHQNYLTKTIIEHIAECPSASVAGGLLRHPCTPEQYKPELAVRYLKGHEQLRNNVGENVLDTLGVSPQVWTSVISAVVGAHPALLSSVPKAALESSEVRHALLRAVKDQRHRAATDPLAQRHLRNAIESLLRHAHTTDRQLEDLERLVRAIYPELISRVLTRKKSDIGQLKERARCTRGTCANDPQHQAALLELIESLNHVELDSRFLLPGSITHKESLSKEHMRVVARNLWGRPDQVLKELQDNGYSMTELAAGVEILGVDSLALLEHAEEVVAILAGQGWEPLRYAYRLSESVREATWRHYRPAHALLHDSNHYTTSIAATLGALDPSSLETALMLLHTWTGSISELVAAAQVLSRPPAL